MKAGILVASLLAASAGIANAAYTSAAICTGISTASSSVTGATDGTLFVKANFQIKCSANTQVAVLDDGSQVAVCSVSKKGKTKFGGSSEGGAVEAKGQCSAAGSCAAEGAVVDTGCAP